MSAANKSGMYHLKPVISLSSENISLPKVMYKLPKILGDSDGIVHQDVANQISVSDVDNLEARQMRILKQICDLKAQIEYLNTASRVSDKKPIATADGFKTQFNKEVADTEIIIYANPSSPPYFIPALQRLWKDITFNIKTHCHSSVIDKTTGLFEEKLLPSTATSVNRIDITLIWTRVPEVQLKTKAYDYSLDGEANVLRYLTRLIEKYNYEVLSESNLIDLLLDLCLQIFYEEPKNINCITSKFAQYLGKDGWFLNFSKPSIVDVALWSTIKRTIPSKIPRDLTKWYNLCEKLFLS